MIAGNLYTAENPVFTGFAFYAAFLCVKMLLMSFLTAIQRFKKGVFANPEDTPAVPGAKVKFDDPAVERVRRAHLNDLENILPFLVLGLLYVGVNPSAGFALLLFRIFAAARVLHTVVYAVVVVPQPARAIAFFASVAVNFIIAFSILSACI